MSRLVELKAEGSDPEFSFGIPDDKNKVRLLPALVLVGGDKDLRLRSFIGTDGHSSTAELRPAPCHNVYWHMLKIADGLREVEKSLQYHQEKRGHPIVAIAQPSLGKSETMGGHVWISLYYKSSTAHDIVHGSGLLWDNDRADYMRPRQWITELGGARLSPGRSQKYMDKARVGEELSLDLCWKKLHYLLAPLEFMLYGSVRTDRTGAGVRDPYVRLPDVQPPNAPDFANYRAGSAYVRFEYRFPSTWLQHPTIAFAYLGLAKLAVLNWEILPSLTDLNLAIQAGGAVQPNKRDLWAAILKERVEALMTHSKFRQTKDLRGLDNALTELYKVKLRFPALIHFDAWASLRPPGA